jgi:alanine racemase
MNNLGPIWVEIDTDTVVKNVKLIRDFVDDNVMVMGVIKSNAYGHDAPEIAPLLLQNGISHLGVARLDEGIELRQNNIKEPILILGLTQKEDMEALVQYNLTATVCNLHNVEHLSNLATRCGKEAKIHLKVDTGLGRIGLTPEDTLSFIKKVQCMKNIQLEGIFTHFAEADNRDKSFTEKQFKMFTSLLYSLHQEKIHLPIEHAANTAAVLDLPHMSLDMVRIGLLLFGLYPSPSVRRIEGIRTTLQFKTRIVYLKNVRASSSISYGRTYTANRNTTVATLPVGYADGYSRLFSNTATVKVRGMKAPVIGSVCMDQTMIDVTDIPGIEIGDEVTLWSDDGFYQSAEWMQSIVNEVVCMTDRKRVPKLFIKAGKPYKIKSMLVDITL